MINLNCDHTIPGVHVTLRGGGEILPLLNVLCIFIIILLKMPGRVLNRHDISQHHQKMLKISMMKVIKH